MENCWTWNNNCLEEIPENKYGFTYLITFLQTYNFYDKTANFYKNTEGVAFSDKFKIVLTDCNKCAFCHGLLIKSDAPNGYVVVNN